MIKPLYVTNYNSLCNSSFDIKVVIKPTQVFREVIIQVDNVLSKIDSRSRFIRYYNIVEINEVGVLLC